MSQSSLLSKKRSGADRYDRHSSQPFHQRKEEEKTNASSLSDSNIPTISSLELDQMDERLGFPRIIEVFF